MSESVQTQFKTCSQAVGAIKSDLQHTDSIKICFAMFWIGMELPTEGKLVQTHCLQLIKGKVIVL